MQPGGHRFSRLYYLGGASLFFLITGVILVSISPFLKGFILKALFVMKPDSVAFDMWKKAVVPIPIDFYFFNWTNPEDILNENVKPRFQQLGPYKFIETKEKAAIKWNSNGTVSFKHLKRWYFDEKNSNGSLSDPVVTLNPIASSAAYSSRNWNYFLRKGLSGALKVMAPTVHMTRTVGQLLFEGYEDPLLKMAQQFPFLAGTNVPFMKKFGWFYGRNNSEDYEGDFSMTTGTDGKQMGAITEWRFKNHTGFYPGSCGSVTGSAGEFFTPGMTKETIHRFFSSDLCRFIDLEYQEDQIKHNMLGYKYIAGDRFLDNGTKIPENKCFCYQDCMPSGAVNISACRYGSPSFVSLPHFQGADPFYTNSIEGLSPVPEKHQFYITFEPSTAIPLEIAARLQLNLLLHPVEYVGVYSNAPKVFIPMLWFEQVVKLPEDLVFKLKILVNIETITTSIGIILICAGFCIQILAVYQICHMKIFVRTMETELSAKEMAPLNPKSPKIIFTKP